MAPRQSCDPIDKLENENQEGKDCHGHGTYVAGLVGGNGTGLATSVTLFSVRVARCEGDASEASLIDGLMCVLQHRKGRNGTRAVVNLSFTTDRDSQGITDAINKVLENDIIFIAAAGNGRNSRIRTPNYNSCLVYPAGHSGVIAVAATDMDDNALMGSDSIITKMGPCVDVFAPGYGILSSHICTDGTPCYRPSSNVAETVGDECSNTCQRFQTGTSASTGIATGAVSLLLEKCPNITNSEVRNKLRTSLSKGRVQFCKAFEYLSKSSDPDLSSAVDDVGTTDNRLLYIGDLPSIDC
ncbi:subtilisin DY-like [Dysidea avara]|uniref:subtilisin DY-like n=1 Tax=Dysidea avara TaxID=196820 RepID=UPI00332E638B